MKWDRPLAEILRPRDWQDFLGQKHLTDPQGDLSRLLDLPYPPSLILWGPPGSGKTTLAHILAGHFQAKIQIINAVSAGVKDIRAAIDRAQKIRDNGGFFILVVDEIHRFHKGQQSTLLQAVEKGELALIGATTENPSFALIHPLLSRCRVLTFEPLSVEVSRQLIEQAEKWFQNQYDWSVDFLQILPWLLRQSQGDARRLLNLLETLMVFAIKKNQEKKEQKFIFTQQHIQNQKVWLNYDKDGDYHYDLISAFIKSMRGSDPDAAIYYLAWMLEGGEDPRFIARRLVIFASEDIGLANGQAFLLAESVFRAVADIGMPEARILLAQATLYLAASPKSNSAYLAIDEALNFVRLHKTRGPEVPLHLRNAPTSFMKQQGYGKEYKYPHDFPGHFVRENYGPDQELLAFYQPTDMGAEKKIKEYLQKLWTGKEHLFMDVNE